MLRQTKIIRKPCSSFADMFRNIIQRYKRELYAWLYTQWLPLLVHEGGSGHGLNDDPKLKLSVGQCLIFVLAGPTFAQRFSSR